MAQAALKLVGKDDTDKQRALEAAIAQIDRAFGKGSVMKLGKAGVVAEIESVPTGRPPSLTRNTRSTRSMPRSWA